MHGDIFTDTNTFVYRIAIATAHPQPSHIIYTLYTVINPLHFYNFF